MSPSPALTRRAFAGLAAGALIAPAVARAEVSQPKLADDGLYHFDWYLDSFLDFAEDLDAAHAKGKRLVHIWSQKGCIYCKKMATEYFVDPKIVDYVRARFDVVHFDMNGARECTDFDGAKFGEKSTALRYQVRTTPTLIFFPETSAGLGKKPEMDRELGRMPGLLPKKEFLAMFTYVGDKGYEKGSFSDWVKTQG
jgi:thioredoxin-related protein